MKKLFHHLLNIIYPRTCVSCETVLNASEKHLCVNCLYTLPKTDSHILPTDLIERKFWGKLNVKNTYSFLKFTKKGKVQKLLHALKYKNKPELAEYMGFWYGTELKALELEHKIDLITGVPLHREKERIRGYNQADHLAKGLSEALKIPLDTEILKRNTFTESQTRRSSRFGRFKNIEGVFTVNDRRKVEGKRIALVDDVLTTGATLEVAGAALLESGCSEIYIITIASAY